MKRLATLSILAAIACSGFLSAQSKPEEAQPTGGIQLFITAEDGSPPSGLRLAKLGADEFANVEVIQAGKRFLKKEAYIPVGGKIAFINKDRVSHNVYCHSTAFKFNIGSQGPGDRHVVVFTTPGKYVVRCALHIDMRLVVVVK